MVSFDEVEFASCIIEKFGVRSAFKDHLTDSAGLLENGGLGVEDGFGRAKGINEVASSDRAYATDGVQD